MSSYATIETLLALAVFLLAWHELTALLRSRREGLTENRSRVVTLSFIMALTVTYAVAAWFDTMVEGEGPITTFGGPTVPWRYLLIGGMLALTAAFEAAALVHARTRGLTSNVSRLVSYSVMLIVMLAMLGLAVGKWEHYLGRLDQTIQADAPALGANR